MKTYQIELAEDKLLEALIYLSDQIENIHNIKLDQNKYDFMIDTLHTFIIHAIEKFIKGEIEHGGDFLNNRNHKEEAKKENIDLMFYIAAIK